MRKKKRCLSFTVLLCVISGVYILWHIIVWNLLTENMPADLDISLLHELHSAQKLTSADQNKPLDRYGYNLVNSYGSKPGRHIPDTRHSSCRSVTSSMPKKFPTASIIITFHHIDRSVLLRNIASILLRSRPVVIHEIIIIEDGSSHDEESEFLTRIPGIKVIRNKESKGRGMARTQGAAKATGDVLVFVDGLVEVNVNWLTPLLLRLMDSPRTIVAPVLDSIDYMTFEYAPVSALFRGGFDWGLQYHWEDIPLSYMARPDALTPVRSPVICGSVLAIRKDFFNWLGKYDQTQGAKDTEDIELSLRSWLCGGQVEIIPCSKVGVIHFKNRELGVSQVSFSTYIRSARRVAEIWLDDYKRFFFAVRPSARMQPKADITIQRKLKERLKCRNFKWYLTFIYPQLQPLISDEVAYGFMQQGNSCIDFDPGQLPIIAKLRKCENDKDSQEWSWRKKGVIVSSGMCLTSDLMKTQGFVVVQFCNDIENQLWYRHEMKIIHQETNLCLDGRQGNTGLLITDCIKDSADQMWHIANERLLNHPGPTDFYSDNDDDHDDVHAGDQL